MTISIKYMLLNICYKVASNMKNHGFSLKNPFHKPCYNQTIPPLQDLTKSPINKRISKTIVCDIQGALLRSKSFFPFFMLVSFEGGSIFRAFLLLLSCPILCVLDHETKIKVMTFITFCGLRTKDMDNVGRAVLPKFYMENLNHNVYGVLASARFRIIVTCIPRVMVDVFLKEYLNVEIVKGTELHVVGEYYTGLVSSHGMLVKHIALKELCGEKMPHVIGVGTLDHHDQIFMSLCKEAYVVNDYDHHHNNINNSANSTLIREKHINPIIFHDARLAFLPTPLASLSMFMWLPIGISLAIFRMIVGASLPYKLAMLVGCASGVNLKVKGKIFPSKHQNVKGPGVLYVCNHRTLLDPIFLRTALGKPLTALTYSLSRVSEYLSPIKTERLTRDKERDKATMKNLLNEGDLVVCPEGTTCREPYLLRFSSLFAELADEIVPVAINTNTTMFHGTTATGLKCLDPIFFLMNPNPTYHIQILEKVPKHLTVSGGRSSHEVANYIQRLLADTLGFQVTNLTRRDKYMMLSRNEGLVQGRRKKS